MKYETLLGATVKKETLSRNGKRCVNLEIAILKKWYHLQSYIKCIFYTVDLFCLIP